ncbi:hypothetical protein F4677DRAFT_427422 [Hypoxylon crocopeplum]|nr:hypothetical protein F4677DRAFT_427422 [Hypoxylon crocopeplum]
MSSHPLVVVVTGVNRGIGRAILDQLTAGHAGPIVLYAASRTITMPTMLTTPTAPPATLAANVIPVQLSLTDSASIDALAAKVRAAHGGCGVLINNAGVYHFREDTTAAERKEMYDVNYFGTIRMCQTFMPIMRQGGRIVNLSSMSGQLRHMAPHLRLRFLAPDLTLSHLEELLLEYEAHTMYGTAAQHGWPSMAYFPSKAALNAGTRILAQQNPHLLINCCCPGWVATDLGSQAGVPPKTPDEGATIPMRLAFGDIEGVSGRYWANDSVSDKGEGKVQPW